MTFEPTRLYIKELAGVKYFGKTTKQNIEDYPGSGVVWNKRIKKYGKKNIKTLWVSDWYHRSDVIQEFALKFSSENKIVESKEWANTIPENGLDGHSRISALLVNGKTEKREEHSKLMSGEGNSRYDPTIYSFIHIDGRQEKCTKLEFRQKYPEMSTSGLASLTSGKSKSDLGWRLITTRLEDTGKGASGRRQIDNKIYEFLHTDGRTEICTRAELIQKYSLSAGHVSSMINGKSKYTHKGWSLKNNL